tara:strand:+ start:1176 stop:1793 length:618 start_codon:yes stop_codon:yes gene_type:complete
MTKQATLIDHERMIYNITRVYRDADKTQHAEGLLWYSDAQKAAHDIAIKYGIAVYIVVAVIAALSPNNKWSRNVRNADALIGAFIRGDGIDSVKVSTYHAMKRKAWDILVARPDYDGAKAMLKGQKITSFFCDIMGEFNVTIDGHARNIAYGERVGLTDDRSNIGVREYRALQAAYEAAAERLGLMPYQLQAITWRVWRDRHGIK